MPQSRDKKTDYKRRFQLAAYTERWAVTMTKVRIRQAVARTPWPHWHLLTFCGRDGGEARGVVDLIAIRKNHGTPRSGMKRGDDFQIILIQVKGGHAASPTAGDGERLRSVARYHRASQVLLATWQKGESAKFFSLRPRAISGSENWREVLDLGLFFQIRTLPTSRGDAEIRD